MINISVEKKLNVFKTPNTTSLVADKPSMVSGFDMSVNQDRS